MTIGEPITQEEFEAKDRRRLRSALSLAVMALLPLTGVKFPCRWEHYRGSSCSGGMMALKVCHAAGFNVRTTCRDKVLYVFRYE